MDRTLYVSQAPGAADGVRTFSTIGAALEALEGVSGEAAIVVSEGVYCEKLTVKKSQLTLTGEGRVVITYGDYAGKLMENGETYGTFRTYTFFVDADDFTARNIIFENSAGPVGQALALYADGDRLVFENCAFLGWQDTIFTGPLPPKEMVGGGFRGPKEFAERINGRHYYKNCYISGHVDFIFGSATAYFENCEIVSRKGGYVTAASTPQGQEYGYVFEGCRLVRESTPEGETACGDESVYLGRPWRDYAKTVFLRCRMDSHIRSEGWHDWKKPHAWETIYYAEYLSTGDGAAPGGEGRAPFSRQLTAEEAEHYTREKVLGGTDGWNP